jgi:hypothetical protein
MTDDYSKWAALDEAIEAEARAQGLHRPEWVKDRVRLEPTATPAQIKAAVTEFRRSEPWWLLTSESGEPVAVAGEVHPPLDTERERRPNGKFAPKPEAPRNDEMNDYLRAHIKPGADEPNVQRLARMVAKPEQPEAAEPTMTELLRAIRHEP